jgi:hypothetical protein
MASDKRLETLQEEVKLLKGEVKHSLASVRDYLLNSELPSADLSGLAGLDDGEQRISMKSSMDSPAAAAAGLSSELMPELTDKTTSEPEMPPEDEDLIDVEPPLDEAEERATATEESAMDQEIITEMQDEPVFRDEEVYAPPEPAPSPLMEQPEEEAGDPDPPPDFDRPTPGADPAIPRVNMLANLITWVSRAKKDIGYDQLPTLLEVYGLSGHLSPELKEVILHFAEITAERPEVPGSAETWSQTMLTLHGILTGGDAPLHAAILSLPRVEEPALEEEEEEELIEVDKQSEPPLKLKLVLPWKDGEGREKEFSIDLAPQDEDGGHRKRRKNGKSSGEG